MEPPRPCVASSAVQRIALRPFVSGACLAAKTKTSTPKLSAAPCSTLVSVRPKHHTSLSTPLALQPAAPQPVVRSVGGRVQGAHQGRPGRTEHRLRPAVPHTPSQRPSEGTVAFGRRDRRRCCCLRSISLCTATPLMEGSKSTNTTHPCHATHSPSFTDTVSLSSLILRPRPTGRRPLHLPVSCATSARAF